MMGRMFSGIAVVECAQGQALNGLCRARRKRRDARCEIAKGFMPVALRAVA